MKTCPIISFETPNGTLIEGPNTLSQDLVDTYGYSMEQANKIVQNIVNPSARGLYSFGTWWFNASGGLDAAKYMTMEGMPTAEAVKDYIKYYKTITSVKRNEITFPNDIKINPILSLDVMSSYVPIFYSKMQSSGISFNHLLQGATIPSEVYQDSFNLLLEYLDNYRNNLIEDLGEGSSEVVELDNLIYNLQTYPFYFQMSFERFAEKFNVYANKVPQTNTDPSTEYGDLQDMEDDIPIEIDEIASKEDTDEDVVVSKDTAFYESSLKTDFKIHAPRAIRMMFQTLADVTALPKEGVEDKKITSRQDYTIVFNEDAVTNLPRPVNSNKLLELVHSVLADVEPNIETQIRKLKEQANIFYMSPVTAPLAAKLDFLIKRIDLFTGGTEIKSKLEKLYSNPPSSLISDEEIKQLFYNTQLRTQWVQQFSKTNNIFYSTLVNEDGTLFRANVNNINTSEKVINEWRANLANSITNSGGSGAHLKKIITAISKAKGSALEKQLQILELIGITLPNPEVFTKITIDGQPVRGKQKNALELFAATVRQYGFRNASELDNLYNFNKNSEIRTKAKKFALLYAQYVSKDIQLSTYNMDRERVYSIGLHSHMTLLSSKINHYLSGISTDFTNEQVRNASINLMRDLGIDLEMQRLAPSLLVHKLMSSKLNLSIDIENGIGTMNNSKAISTRKLNPVEKLIMDMRAVSTGSIPLLQAGDRPVFMSISLKNDLNNIESLNHRDRNLQISRIKNAIRYEILQSAKYFNQGIGKGIKNVSHDDFRAFEGLLAKLNEGLSKPMTMQDIAELELATPLGRTYNNLGRVFNDLELENKIDEFIKDLEDKNIREIKSMLKTFGIKTKEDFKSLAPAFENFSDNYEEALRLFILTNIANSTDQIRLFTGDATLFKDSADFSKRYMTLNSTKQIQRIDPEINAAIQLMQLMPSREKLHPVTNPGWRVYAEERINQGIVPTITLKEPISKTKKPKLSPFATAEASRLLKLETAQQQTEEIKKELVKQLNDNLSPYFEDTEVGDGIAYMTLDALRRTLFRSGIYSDGHESLYQKILNNTPITLDDLKKARFTSLKLQYSGPYMTQGHMGAGFNAVRKYMVMPLIPGIVKEGTGLHKLMVFMEANKIEQSIMPSAAKVTHGRTYNVNNIEEEFRQALEEDMYTATDDLHASFMGIQTVTNEQPKGYITQSKQMRRHELNDVLESGSFTIQDPEFQQIFNNYDTSHAELIQEKDSKFIQSIGFDKFNSLDSWRQADLSMFVDKLISAARKRDFSESTIQTIALLKKIDDITKKRTIQFLDELPIFNEIQYLINKLFNSEVVSLKRNGESYAQVPDLGFSQTLEDRTLEFYRLSSNKKVVLPAQVKMTLPDLLFKHVAKTYGNGKFTQKALDAFNEDVKKDEEAFIKSNGTELTELTKLRRMVGFRTPHQSKSFSEVSHVVEYLNPILSATIVVPHETVVKNNSDFDHDKFNTYQAEARIKDGEIEILDSTMNKLLNYEVQLILNPEVFYDHLIPASDTTLRKLADKVIGLKKINLGSNPMSGLISYATQLSHFVKYQQGKNNVGMSVKNISNLSVLQSLGEVIESKTGYAGLASDSTSRKKLRINLGIERNQVLPRKLIFDQVTTAFLDSASDTGYPYFINMYGPALNAFFAGVHLGNPERTLLIINQPIITEFLRRYTINLQGVLLNKYKNRKQVIESLLPSNMTYSDFNKMSVEGVKITDQDLINAIQNPESESAKAIQIYILRTFTDLLKINNTIYNIQMQNSTDDASAKTFDELEDKVTIFQDSYIKAFKFIEALSNATLNLSSKVQYMTLSSIVDLGLDSIKSRMLEKDWQLKVNKKNRKRLFEALRSQFVPVAMSKEFIGDFGFDYQAEIDRLTKGDNSLAKRLHKIQNDSEDILSEDMFLMQFQPMLNYQGSGYDIIIPRDSNADSIDRDLLDLKHEQLTRILDRTDTLLSDLVKLSVIQSGFLPSKFNLIPYMHKVLVHQELSKFTSALRDTIMIQDVSILEDIASKYPRAFIYAYMHNMPISSEVVSILEPNLQGMIYQEQEEKKVLTDYNPAKYSDKKSLQDKMYFTTESSKFLKLMTVFPKGKEKKMKNNWVEFYSQEYFDRFLKDDPQSKC